MDVLANILCAAGGFAFGTLAAFINARISRRGLRNSTTIAVMGTNAVRMLIDIAALVIAFFACKLFDLPVSVTIIAVALGLTICGMLFLRKLTKQILEEEKNLKDGGE